MWHNLIFDTANKHKHKHTGKTKKNKSKFQSHYAAFPYPNKFQFFQKPQSFQAQTYQSAYLTVCRKTASLKASNLCFPLCHLATRSALPLQEARQLCSRSLGDLVPCQTLFVKSLEICHMLLLCLCIRLFQFPQHLPTFSLCRFFLEKGAASLIASFLSLLTLPLSICTSKPNRSGQDWISEASSFNIPNIRVGSLIFLFTM